MAKNENVFIHGEPYQKKEENVSEKEVVYFNETQVDSDRENLSFSSLDLLLKYMLMDDNHVKVFSNIELGRHPLISPENLCSALSETSLFPKNILMSVAYTYDCAKTDSFFLSYYLFTAKNHILLMTLLGFSCFISPKKH